MIIGWHMYEAKDCRVRVKKAPFGMGAMRTAYYMQDVTDPDRPLNLVAKQKSERHENSFQYAMNDLSTQLCAKYFVDEYMVDCPLLSLQYLL
jgi:hypothetical protein